MHYFSPEGLLFIVKKIYFKALITLIFLATSFIGQAAAPIFNLPSTDPDGTFPISWSSSGSYVSLYERIGGSYSTKPPIFQKSASGSSTLNRPEGVHTFKMTFSTAGRFGTTSSSIIKTITVGTPNHAPVITEGSAITLPVLEDTLKKLTLHATDADGDALTWSINTTKITAKKGIATIGGIGTSQILSYTPYDDETGTDVFEVRVSDGELAQTIEITAEISAVNDTLVITQGTSLAVDVNEGVRATIELNVIDIDGSSYEWTVLSGPTNGTVNFPHVSEETQKDSQVHYMPTINYIGGDSFVMQVSDGSKVATITINITISGNTSSTHLLINDAPYELNPYGTARRKVFYIHTDLLGSPAAETDAKGNLQ